MRRLDRILRGFMNPQFELSDLLDSADGLRGHSIEFCTEALIKHLCTVELGIYRVSAM